MNMTEMAKKELRRQRRRSSACELSHKQPRRIEKDAAAQNNDAFIMLLSDQDSDSQNYCETKSNKNGNLCEASNQTTKCTQTILDHIRSPINYLSELLTGVIKKTTVPATTTSEMVDEECSHDQSQEMDKIAPVSRSARPSRLSVTVISISDDDDTALTCDACESDSEWPSERQRRDRSRSRSVPPQDSEFHYTKPIVERLDTLRSALRCTVMHAVRGSANKARRIIGGNRTSSRASEILSDWRVRRTLLRIEKELRALVRIEPQRTVLRTNAFSLTASDLNTIAGSDTNWLNDAVINAYLSLVASSCSTESVRSTVRPPALLANEKGDGKRINLPTTLRNSDFMVKCTGRSPKKGRLSLSPSVPHQSAMMRALAPTANLTNKNRTSLRVYAFNSFMYAKLCKSGYDGVQRWTKKTDILANYDILLFPINLPDHWTLAVADLRTQTLSFYDSLLNDMECEEDVEGKAVLKDLFNYLNNESLMRHGIKLDSRQWQLGQLASGSTEKRTLQRNGSDCGIFVCKYAEAIARGAPLYFDAEESLNARRQLLCELMLLATLHSLDYYFAA